MKSWKHGANSSFKVTVPAANHSLPSIEGSMVTAPKKPAVSGMPLERGDSRIFEIEDIAKDDNDEC